MRSATTPGWIGGDLTGVPERRPGDRRHVLHHRRPVALRDLIFFVTSRCNFRCRTCFYASVMDHSLRDGVPELTYDEIAGVASSIGPLRTLLLSGGEPFLRDDLARVCETFAQRCAVRGVHLPTNGSDPERVEALTSDILKRCPDTRVTVAVSLDGLRETHDRIKRFAGAFDRAVETIRRLARVRDGFPALELSVISVVSDANVHEAEELCAYVRRELPVNSHGPSPLRGQPADAGLSPPSAAAWNDLWPRLMPYHAYWNARTAVGTLRRTVATNRIRYLYRSYGRILAGFPLPFRCQAGRAVGVLEADGGVRLCELTEVVGNVRDAGLDFPVVWRSDSAERARSNTGTCACTHACFLLPSIAANPLSRIGSCLCFR